MVKCRQAPHAQVHWFWKQGSSSLALEVSASKFQISAVAAAVCPQIFFLLFSVVFFPEDSTFACVRRLDISLSVNKEIDTFFSTVDTCRFNVF